MFSAIVSTRDRKYRESPPDIRHQAFIGARPVDAACGDTVDGLSPVAGRTPAKVVGRDARAAGGALAAAQLWCEFGGWSRMTPGPGPAFVRAAVSASQERLQR